MGELLSGLLAISLAANCLLIYLLKTKPKQKIEQSYDVRALLLDLASGPALVKIEYLDRADVLLRSPRHM